MSWDVFIQHLPASALRVADIPDDFLPLPLGSRADVLRIITRVLPNADATDPTWLVVTGAGYSIEISVGPDDPVTSVALHIRGDDSVIPVVTSLVEALGARALDSWTGEFFDPVTAVDSIRQWRAYVDQQLV